VPDFSSDQRSRLCAVIDRIIPTDQDPGALDLGADRYVLAQLAEEAAEFAGEIAVGLDALDLAGGLQFGAPFQALPPEQQDTLLAQFEQQPWFLELAELTAEGFYADPANGGNRDARSWAMIGYEHRLPDGPSGREASVAARTSATRQRHWPYPPDDPAPAAGNANSVRGQ
jgi:hypothetical protein